MKYSIFAQRHINEIDQDTVIAYIAVTSIESDVYIDLQQCIRLANEVTFKALVKMVSQ